MAFRSQLGFALIASLLSLALASNPLAAGTGHTVGFGELKEEWRGEVIHLSWSPRAFLLKGFLSDEECDHIVSKAEPKMVKSSVVDNETGKSVDSDIRTSTGTWFAKGEDEVIARVEKRVAQVTMIPLENHEGLQVLHYRDGQKYEPHYDYFHDTVNAAPEHGGQRVVTVLMYLTTVEEGGETVLPHADQKVTGPEWSECAQRGLSVKAVKGDALMFYSLKPDGSNDPASLHGSCPTVRGDKWSATKWIHVGPIGGLKKLNLGTPECHDENEQCQEWAFFGECTKNPGYMKENCPRSCKHCTIGVPAGAA
ncbi:Prolyl 4-hydroxylase subunit alpha-1 [Tetrabaena socialis]|uniref:procollagen-proline 4-dioxygenase n=1 Tax=Tetrabaena socialis TaxID=47790 RepID=A0A2J8A9A4_9CHLO|nr:Prolyl 4-hydroxylase subunit alpha-1 [Tetrabaena socialis]|eukprot:PNH09081.1 Prolyl 4-hydroxylase subunit alpha-1 [Tetrabaena socialis]